MMQTESQNPYAVNAGGPFAADAVDSERLTFIRRTYAHLSGAVAALIALEAVLFAVVPAQTMEALVVRMISGYGWLIVMGLFIGVSWMANSWARSATSRPMQYAGLGLYVGAQGIILLPMLYICIRVLNEPNLPLMAAGITAMAFMGLTAFTFMTRVDLIGWGKYLALGGFVAMGVIVAGIVFGFSLGLLFSGAMVALACGYILYNTSMVMHHYHTDQYVAASLTLFADVVLLFWYVLQILMSFSSSD